MPWLKCFYQWMVGAKAKGCLTRRRLQTSAQPGAAGMHAGSWSTETFASRVTASWGWEDKIALHERASLVYVQALKFRHNKRVHRRSI